MENRNLVVLGLELFDKGNVLLLGLLLGKALELLPSVPLVLALEVKDAGGSGGIVANGCLLVQGVELVGVVSNCSTAISLSNGGAYLEKLVGGGLLGELLNRVSGVLESLRDHFE